MLRALRTASAAALVSASLVSATPAASSIARGLAIVPVVAAPSRPASLSETWPSRQSRPTWPLRSAQTSSARVDAAATNCFLLFDERSSTAQPPSGNACNERVTPASTFKIPHALAALDAAVIGGPHEVFTYGGVETSNSAWKRDHDLASAMRYSVVWYFQRLAERLGAQREADYLKKFAYGNQDASGPLTQFWLGSSLQISPREQLDFLRRFFVNQLPVSAQTASTVRDILVQPHDHIVNATGEHPMGAPWPSGTTVWAKTGAATDKSGKPVTWLVGRVERDGHAWLFVSCVIGSADGMAAVNQASSELKRRQVL